MCHNAHVNIKKNLVEIVLSFYLYMGSMDKTQVVRLTLPGSKCLYLQNHLARPISHFTFFP